MFQGSMVALVTPMHTNGNLDDEGLARLIEFHIESGTDAIVAAGTTGESATLDEEEHCSLIRRVVDIARGRIPVIAGTGANSTMEAMKFTRCAKEDGADACLLVTPYYNKPTQEGLYRHYKAIADAISIPQILYNVPSRTACDLLPNTVLRLSRIPNIIGIKEANGFSRVQSLLAICPQDFEIYSGDDSMAMETILAGGRGAISVTANIAPVFMHNMCAKALKGDRNGAKTINDKLVPLHKKLFVESNPIPVKWALYEMGMIRNGIRLPLTLLSDTHYQEVRQALRIAGVIFN
uniref:4-hydroxy-tetrahydrodipicolinate synthase n=1 Tax=Candidatus Kentrum sp. TC TaxID=2126339 RepID=A0A451AFE2_9GAMM|nr:MAG: 4-hydroxy-tetrahydrodipicolinate synthase [Candidatus Kentron sp. TC]VFK51064.1 MAG: 4-hydroxy-tetrahydrodipicolinate synthase [Candidatus Kentron sp. TC]VFK64767.1 MAG: 4-hydroxy-tetrahydrodipicolinate synthase [Candidatus Kentron sp. TC]